MSMTESTRRLPGRKSSIEVLAGLDQAARDKFGEELLDALWECHEAGDLPPSIVRLLRDWIAHAHFETDPVVRERLADARRRASTV